MSESNVYKLDYIKDKLEIDKIQGGLMAMDIFVLINYSLSLEYPNTYKEKLKLVGKEHLKYIIKRYNSKHLKNIQTLKFILEKIKISVLGEIKVLLIGKNKYIINLYNGSFPNQYKKLFGFQKLPVDYFMSGIIEGALEFVFNKKAKVKEKVCIAQGRKNCIFEGTLI